MTVSLRQIFGSLLAIAFAARAAAAPPPSPTPAAKPDPREGWLEQMIGKGQGAQAALPQPDQREVWVPANKLKDILAKYPNAVVLSREQYETLVRDAALDKKQAPAAPRRAALTEAKYQARLLGKVVQVTAALTVNVLADEWAQVALDFGGASIGALSVDGEAALMPERSPQVAKGAPPAKAAAPSALLLRGRGERKVAVEFTLPVALEAGLSRVRMKLPPVAASSFGFDLPANQRVESPQPISIKKTSEMTSVTAALAPSNPVLELSWRGAGDAAPALSPLVLANGIYTIDAEKVRAEFGFAIETQLGNLPVAFQIPLPANVKVLQVTGDELARWEVADGRLAIALQAGERTAAKLWLAMEMPSLAAAPRATLALPVPRIEGLARMQGVYSLVGDAGVTVEQVVTDGAATPTDRACEPVAHFVASYKYITPPAGPRVTVERVQPRFSADLDTLVEFRPEAIFIERTLTLHREKGDVFSTGLALPAGEEVLAVRNADDSEPDWRMEGGKLRLRWSDLGDRKADRVFKIRTRIEPEKWTQLGADGLTFTLGDAQIDGAEKVAGYIALQAAASFRLEAEASETLERRDGRTTPVRGDYAWFRRAEFSLNVKVAKRPGEVLASLTGYALPLEGVLDLHAQMNFQFLYSGARSVRIRVPKALAANFNFDGPQIAERSLAEDIWTIVFQKELTGGYGLKITAQVPVAMPKDAVESRFTVAVPAIVPLDVVRASGVWAVEANTETEITFDAKGMNELDSLLAPRLPDYAPRHRVIGVFAWLGADYTLALSGVRHAPAAVLTSVVDQLTLDTVVSTSGTERSQAVFQVRTAGAQYLDVRLPEKSRLLSLSVDDELVKPVGERADQVRVQLPAKRDATSAVAVSILYETPQGEWRGSGGYAARAPQLAKSIPILRSQWRLHLPDGFEYTGMESNLRVLERVGEAPLILAPVRMWDEWQIAGAFAVLGTSGMKDPGDPRQNLSERQRRLFDADAMQAPAKSLFTLPRPAAPAAAVPEEPARPEQKAAVVGGFGGGQRVSGILPMKIELPTAGRVMVLEGLSAAERVEFRYDDWWGRARRLWLWFVAGGLGCLFVAGERPWWRTCWAVLLLTFVPLVVSVGTMAICNALLAGWLVSVVLQRVAARVVFAREKKEVPA